MRLLTTDRRPAALSVLTLWSNCRVRSADRGGGQTAKATEEIGQNVSMIQASTKNAVDAVREIGNAVRDVNDITSNIGGGRATGRGTLPGDVLEQIDKYAEAHGFTRSGLPNTSRYWQ